MAKQEQHVCTACNKSPITVATFINAKTPKGRLHFGTKPIACVKYHLPGLFGVVA
jgi:hypothetical protein